MIIWEAFNSLMDWMNVHGSNDYASLTIIMLVGAIVWGQVIKPLGPRAISVAKEAILNWRRKKRKTTR